MAFELYGGIPRVSRFTAANGNAIDTTGRGVSAVVDPFTRMAKTNFVQVKNTGSNPVSIYFRKDEFDANGTDGFIQILATNGFWEGPATLEDGQQHSMPILYLRGVGGSTDVEVVFFVRRS